MNHHYKIQLWNILARRMKPLKPDSIFIEISTACNRSCHYCPQSQRDIGQKIISDVMWDFTLYRLQQFNWRGMTMIHMYGEPTLVPSVVSKIKQLKEIGCYVYLFSNGDVFDRLQECMESGVDRACITQHAPTSLKWQKNMLSLKQRYGRKIKIQSITADMMHNQAGKIDIEVEPLKNCYTAWAMPISVTGKVGICCLDIDFEGDMGSIVTQSIEEIWNSEKYRRARRIVSQGKSFIKSCDGCFGIK